MNNYLIKKLKEGRTNAGFKQAEVASKIGIKPNTLSNYENGVSEPDIDTFCALCDIYKLNPAEILKEAYGLNIQGSDFTIRPSEIEHVKKYRLLDPKGQEHVSTVLDWESQRTSTIAQKDSRIAELEQQSKVTQLPDRSYLEPNAAHDRTDISDDSRTDELKNLEASIMGNEDEWK